MYRRMLEKSIIENINKLINSQRFNEAKDLLSQYEMIATNKISIYSIKSVLAMINGEMDLAKKVLYDGLSIYPNNEELLLNNSYLNDLLGNKKNAIESYAKAKLFNYESSVKIEDFISEYENYKNTNLRVFHGTMEIANQMNLMVKSLRKLDIDVTSLNYYPSYLKYDSDRFLDISKFKTFEEANVATKNLASEIISENIDVFHFHFDSTLALDKSDLKLLSELNKKMVMQYWGSEVRMYSKAVKLNPYVKVKVSNEDSIIRNIVKTSSYIDSCIVDYELAEYVKDYYENIYYNRVAIDLEKYSITNLNNLNKKPLIVHAPTSPEIKGSDYIITAIEKLKLKYNFDFKLVKGVAHEEAKKIYEKADLIIDQILAGSYGVFAVESMAMGKPVICHISDFMKEKYPVELPIIIANPDNIEKKIEYCLKNIDSLREIGLKGRQYVEKYHDMNLIAKENLSIYNKL